MYITQPALRVEKSERFRRTEEMQVTTEATAKVTTKVTLRESFFNGKNVSEVLDRKQFREADNVFLLPDFQNTRPNRATDSVDSESRMSHENASPSDLQ